MYRIRDHEEGSFSARRVGKRRTFGGRTDGADLAPGGERVRAQALAIFVPSTASTHDRARMAITGASAAAKSSAAQPASPPATGASKS
jgi:hypothetical protein